MENVFSEGLCFDFSDNFSEKNVGEKFENKHITKRAEIFYINQNTAPPHKGT